MTAMHGPVTPAHGITVGACPDPRAEADAGDPPRASGAGASGVAPGVPDDTPDASPAPAAPTGTVSGQDTSARDPGLPGTAARDLAARTIADRAEGEAFVASVCFKHGPPRLTGVELEHLVHDRSDPAAPVDPARLRRALGTHAPPTLTAVHAGPPTTDSPPTAPTTGHGQAPEPLPAGSALTLEPGGQVEVSTRPHTSVGRLITAATTDLGYVTELLATEGLALGTAAIDPFRPPRRILGTERYAAMERRFAAYGAGGATMMCSTAAVQVCLDAGEAAELPARWAAVHALGPVLLALFANSSTHAGRDTGHACARWRAVMDTEPARTEPPRTDPGIAETDPALRWARRVLDTPLMVRRRASGPWDAPGRLTFADWIAGRGAARGWPRPTFDDLDYHLTTLFTPVRPRGHLEVRYLDAQPPGRWADPVAVLAALLRSPAVIDRVRELCAPVEGRWSDAARRGLADPALARAARGVAEVGCDGLDALDLNPATVTEIGSAVDARLHRAGAPVRHTRSPRTSTRPSSARRNPAAGSEEKR